MVDAIVSKVISDLNSIIVHEEPMPFAFIEELRKLCLSFKHIRPVLEDAERRAVTDNSALEWVLKLKDLAFQADDMVDDWRIAALSSVVQEIEGVGSSNEVGNQSLCLHFSGMVSGNKIIKRVKKLRKELERIVDETTMHKFCAGRSNSTANSQVKLFSSPEESKIFGREEEKNEIISFLLKKSSRNSSDIPAVSIEGVKGLGKTTLAQLVYEDQRVKKQFERRVWVCAYGQDLIQIMENIYKTVNPNKDDTNLLENLQLKLAEILRQTQNLFVFDDYMVKDSKMWETLNLVLKFSQKGSKIIVISYDDIIEKLIQPTYKHHLKGLSPEDSWAVLSHKALRGRSSEDCLELEKIGRKIVEKCQGMPLALKVAGGALFNGSDNIGSLLRSASKLQSLRSLVVLPIGPTNNVSELFQQLTCLRVLDLSYSRITEVPSIIGSTKHLRYLDLSGTKIAALPMSVTDLCSLQTLRLNQCSLLRALPNRIDKLVSLRHLEFEETETLRNLPEKIRELSTLRTLSKFWI